LYTQNKKIYRHNLEMAAGSYLRFFIGLLLSLEVLREWFFGPSYISLILAAIFIMLSVAWFAFRF